MYNTASITLSNFPNGATPITVTRDGQTIANAVANVGAVGGTAGAATLNVPGLVGVGHVLDCWTTFTPDILPGDIITIGGVAGTTVTAPDFTVSAPSQVGSELFTRGKAADAAGNPMAGVVGQLFSAVNRFSVGNKGGQLLGGGLTFDAPGSSSYTARFAGTPGDLAIGLSATAQITTIPPAVHPVGGVAAVMTIGAQTGAPGPVAGCPAPLGSDAVTGATTKTINQANANQALTLTGTTDPNVKAVSVNVGGSVVPATLAGATWSATVNPANLPDGTLTAAGSYTGAGGVYHGRTMSIVKDTVAPGAVTANLAPGSYPSARTVALSAEPGATIHYTTNGSDPTASSTSYAGAIAVAQSQSIKAIAVDAAGNPGPVAQFDYAINPPSIVQPLAPKAAVAPSLAKLKLDSMTMSSRIGLRSVRRNGLQVVVFAPEGAKVLRIRLLRGSKRLDDITRKVTGDGVVTVNLPGSRRVRRALKRGSYQVLVTPGRSAKANDMGVTTLRTFKVR
jgi:hypothetical protein